MPYLLVDFSSTCELAGPLVLGAELLQVCLTLRNPTNCSPLGYAVHGILLARILDWVSLPPFKPLGDSLGCPH